MDGIAAELTVQDRAVLEIGFRSSNTLSHHMEVERISSQDVQLTHIDGLHSTETTLGCAELHLDMSSEVIEGLRALYHNPTGQQGNLALVLIAGIMLVNERLVNFHGVGLGDIIHGDAYDGSDLILVCIAFTEFPVLRRAVVVYSGEDYDLLTNHPVGMLLEVDHCRAH